MSKRAATNTKHSNKFDKEIQRNVLMNLSRCKKKKKKKEKTNKPKNKIKQQNISDILNIN